MQELRLTRPVVRAGRKKLQKAWKELDLAEAARPPVPKAVVAAQAARALASENLDVAEAAKARAWEKLMQERKRVKKYSAKLNKVARAVRLLPELVVSTRKEFAAAKVCHSYGFPGEVRIAPSVPDPLAGKLIEEGRERGMEVVEG